MLSCTKLSLIAYDCQRPENVRNESVEVMNACEDGIRNEAKTNETLQILQKTKYVRVKAYRCSLVRTQHVAYCGTYDHQTRLNSHSYTEL